MSTHTLASCTKEELTERWLKGEVPVGEKWACPGETHRRQGDLAHGLHGGWAAIPAVDHDGPGAGSCLWALVHLSHEAQQRPGRLWGLVVRPGREEDVLHWPALVLMLAWGHA